MTPRPFGVVAFCFPDPSHGGQIRVVPAPGRNAVIGQTPEVACTRDNEVDVVCPHQRLRAARPHELLGGVLTPCHRCWTLPAPSR